MTNSALSLASHWASVTYSNLLRAENVANRSTAAGFGCERSLGRAFGGGSEGRGARFEQLRGGA